MVGKRAMDYWITKTTMATSNTQQYAPARANKESHVWGEWLLHIPSGNGPNGMETTGKAAVLCVFAGNPTLPLQMPLAVFQLSDPR